MTSQYNPPKDLRSPAYMFAIILSGINGRFLTLYANTSACHMIVSVTSACSTGAYFVGVSTRLTGAVVATFVYKEQVLTTYHQHQHSELLSRKNHQKIKMFIWE